LFAKILSLDDLGSVSTLAQGIVIDVFGPNPSLSELSQIAGEARKLNLPIRANLLNLVPSDGRGALALGALVGTLADLEISFLMMSVDTSPSASPTDAEEARDLLQQIVDEVNGTDVTGVPLKRRWGFFCTSDRDRELEEWAHSALDTANRLHTIDT